MCPVHGVFEQLPYSHSKGFGCAKCANCYKSNTQDFIKKANKIHNNKYIYNKVDYKNAHSKIEIICKSHGQFIQSPNKHLSGQGCPRCRLSQNENIIEKYLISNSIKYIPQKTFENCKYKRKLHFDFYLPDYNTCIEYDGEQHFRKFNTSWGDEVFKLTKIRDNIKNVFCKKNNINLLRIKFNENINNKLDEALNI